MKLNTKIIEETMEKYITTTSKERIVDIDIYCDLQLATIITITMNHCVYKYILSIEEDKIIVNCNLMS